MALWLLWLIIKFRVSRKNSNFRCKNIIFGQPGFLLLYLSKQNVG
jgi:hypothetical protein